MSHLKDNMNKLHAIIEHLKKDLEKCERGNKAAAQRVRTASIKFAKVAKDFRKISIKSEKSGEFHKHKEATRKAKSSKKSAKSGKAAKKVHKKVTKKPVVKKHKKPIRKASKKR